MPVCVCVYTHGTQAESTRRELSALQREFEASCRERDLLRVKVCIVTLTHTLHAHTGTQMHADIRAGPAACQGGPTENACRGECM